MRTEEVIVINGSRLRECVELVDPLLGDVELHQRGLTRRHLTKINVIYASIVAQKLFSSPCLNNTIYFHEPKQNSH